MISLRIEKLRERLINEPRRFRDEQIAFELTPDLLSKLPIVRKAFALERVLRETHVFIEEDELIVGSIASTNFLSRYVLPDHLTPEERAQVMANRDVALPEDVRAGLAMRLFSAGDAADGHICANYEKVLRVGFDGLLKGLAHSFRPKQKQEADPQREAVWEAMEIALRAGIAFALRYADEAEALACCDRLRLGADRRHELLAIADICRRVPRQPARTLHEALQSFWFTQTILQLETAISAFSPGRMDQYLLPYYLGDLESKRLTSARAEELLQALWIKFNDNNDIAYDSGQAITIGGVTPDGCDATNVLSFLFLKAVEEIRLPQPKLNARIHERTPPEFLEWCAEVTRHNLGPVLYNDRVIIDGLTNTGIPLDLARDYAIIGCFEVTLPGRENARPMTAIVNLLRVLEIVIHDGRCPRSGARFLPAQDLFRTKRKLPPPSFRELLARYNEAVSRAVEGMAVANNIGQLHVAPIKVTPFLSALVDGCIEKGRDVWSGGAEFNTIGARGVGLANVADSLAALREVVYEKKEIAFQDILHALSDDFRNAPELRLRLDQRCPKFGNDDGSVDELAKEIGEAFCRDVLKQKNLWNERFRPGLFSFNATIPCGDAVGATPDGRRAGAPTSKGVSPAQGRDTHGPTVAIRSVTKIDFTLSPNAATFDLKFMPSSFKGTEAQRLLAAMLKTFLDLGGLNVQVNVIDNDTLRRAKQRPDEYRGLLVRVSGYSDYFVRLDARTQDEIISRLSHELGR